MDRDGQCSYGVSISLQLLTLYVCMYDTRMSITPMSSGSTKIPQTCARSESGLEILTLCEGSIWNLIPGAEDIVH